MNKIPALVFSLLTCIGCLAQPPSNDPLTPPIPGLPTAELSSVKINKDSISKIIKTIRTTAPNDFRGIVVTRNGKLVVEEYFNTFWRENINDIRSAGKSVTSILLGIAIDKGLVKSVEQSVYDFFPAPKYKTPANDKHRDIKIKHLLMMSSGLDADDDNGDSPGNTGNWLMREDWVNFAISLPMLFTPGEKMVYNDVCPMLIGAIIEETSGKKLSEFARENLFTPLGIREYYWYTAPNGKTGPMGNLYISAIDFAKIGQVVLDKGKWQGKQIVSSAWVSEVTADRMDISKTDPRASSYGYFWWIAKKKVGDKEYRCVYASGNGGNLLFVVPSENLVVSLLSSAYGQGYAHRRSHGIMLSVLRSLE